jgi:hypothetical protein
LLIGLRLATLLELALLYPGLLAFLGRNTEGLSYNNNIWIRERGEAVVSPGCIGGVKNLVEGLSIAKVPLSDEAKRVTGLNYISLGTGPGLQDLTLLLRVLSSSLLRVLLSTWLLDPWLSFALSAWLGSLLLGIWLGIIPIFILTIIPILILSVVILLVALVIFSVQRWSCKRDVIHRDD